MFGPKSAGGKDTRHLISDEKRRKRNAESLAVTIAGELADVERLRKDLESVKGILVTTNKVGPLNSKKDSNTAGVAFGEYIEVLMELTHVHSKSGYMARLRNIAKSELKNMKQLRDDWPSIERNNDVNLVRKTIANSFQNLAYALREEQQSLSKQEREISEILRA